MDRYRVVLTRNGQRFGILDREEYDYCGLATDDGLVPLEWRTKPAAEAWLHKCYRIWQMWERDGAGTPPKGWRPHQLRPSPFDRSAGER